MAGGGGEAFFLSDSGGQSSPRPGRGVRPDRQGSEAVLVGRLLGWQPQAIPQAMMMLASHSSGYGGTGSLPGHPVTDDPLGAGGRPPGRGCKTAESEGPWENVRAGTRGWHGRITYRNSVPSGNSACVDFILLITLPSTALSSGRFLVLLCHVLPGSGVPGAKNVPSPGVESVPTPRGGRFVKTGRPHARGHTPALVYTGSAHACTYTCVLACTRVHEAHIYTQRGVHACRHVHTHGHANLGAAHG